MNTSSPKKASEFNLSELLHLEPENGLIRLQDYRMVMQSACALGALRKELIETLGWTRARSLMKRFGYAAGLADGHALAERFPEATGARHLNLGPALHALEGIAQMVPIPESSEIDLERGKFHIEAYWENSFEAEQHLALLGPSKEPICWTLVGYAAGHSASAVNDQTVVVETECHAMGHDRCRFTVALARDLPEVAAQEAEDFTPQHLPAVLQELHGTLKRQQRSLRSKEKTIERLRHQVQRAQPKTPFIGSSPQLAAALKTAQAVAPYKATALLLGESGTGKELLARSIHDQSPRADKPFVAVNCSALPETLQEAELFGYAKGAFTGATGANPGVFESADGGTLFLDEIGDLSLSAQTKMLRALQEGEVKRLGESRIRKVDTRIVAATHRDLETMVAQKSFRQDLYYRLSVVAVTLPPLRERGHDSLLLADHFVQLFAKRFGKDVHGFSREARCAMAEYTWPGNVRELENAVQRGVIMASAQQIEVDDLPSLAVHGPSAMSAPRDAVRGRQASSLDPRLSTISEEPERLRRALELANGHRGQAADLLGISRTTLWRKLKAFDSSEDPDAHND